LYLDTAAGWLYQRELNGNWTYLISLTSTLPLTPFADWNWIAETGSNESAIQLVKGAGTVGLSATAASVESWAGAYRAFDVRLSASVYSSFHATATAAADVRYYYKLQDNESQVACMIGLIGNGLPQPVSVLLSQPSATTKPEVDYTVCFTYGGTVLPNDFGMSQLTSVHMALNLPAAATGTFALTVSEMNFIR
jgi:hypothetical protein